MTSEVLGERAEAAIEYGRAFVRMGAYLGALAILCACGPGASGSSANTPGMSTGTSARSAGAPSQGTNAAVLTTVPPGPGTLFQAGTFSQLLAGDYRGIWSFSEIKRQGNFGLGTFEGINGELVVADGGYWQVHPNGHVTEVTDQQRTPYVEVLHFRPESQREITTPLTCAETLRALLSDLAGLNDGVASAALVQPSESTATPSADAPTTPDATTPDERIDVFRIRGRFSAITTRAIDLQTPPYRPLKELISTQHEFPMENVSGTLVAIRAPKNYAPVTIPGYHFHFITEDHQRGGHVLSCTLDSGTAEYQPVSKWTLWLPPPDPSH